MRVRLPLVAWLGATTVAPDAWDGLLGGKGASLERLLRMGAPMPPGFCITTEAFRAHLHREPHASRAEAAVRRLPEPAAARALADLLTMTPFPAELADALETGVARLAASDPGVQLAVRSSAVGEDGSQASFAGIHETELGRRADEVPEAVRRCWESLWSHRALEYRSARGLPLDGAMAVIVQRLVPADAAAVVFTRHPISGRDDVVYLNAVRGLGEALVSGTVTPDEVVLSKGDLAIVDLIPGDTGRVLSDAQLADLAMLSLNLERRFQRPIDIEAAHAEGRWYVLQARPITA